MTIGRPRYGGFVWLNRAYDWPGQEDSYALSGTGGQSTVIFPRHDLVVVRMAYVKGEKIGDESTDRTLKLILEAVPQPRPGEAPYPAKL